MSLYGAGLIFVTGFFGLLYPVLVRKVWRGGSALRGDHPPEWWFLGVPIWRGNARAFVATIPLVLLMCVGAIIAEFGGQQAYDPGMAVAAAGLLGLFLVQLPIVFFNRPRFAVPPHLRDEPGALAEMRARRRRATR